MTTKDLGDPRLYEDEAIREQAAALQIHVQSLTTRLALTGYASRQTEQRIFTLNLVMRDLWKLSDKLLWDDE